MTTKESRSTEILGWKHDKAQNVWLLIGVHGGIMGFSRGTPNWGSTSKGAFKHLMILPGGPLHEE